MPGNLGMTIFEHLLAQEQQKQLQDQQRAEQAKQEQLLMNEKLSQALDYKLQRDDKDFDRQLEVAKLWGQYGSQAGEGAPRKMDNPALQEMTDVQFGLEQQRLPTAKRMFEATKLPIELERTRRENTRTQGRMTIEGLKTDRAREQAGNKAELAAYDRELKARIHKNKMDLEWAKLAWAKDEKNPRNKAILDRLQKQSQKDVMDWLKLQEQQFNDRNDEAVSAMQGGDEDAMNMANLSGALGAMVQSGSITPEAAYGFLSEAMKSKYPEVKSELDLIGAGTGQSQPETPTGPTAGIPPRPGE